MLVEFVIGSAIALWLLFTFVRRSHWWKRSTKHISSNNSICSNSNCVRCHRNESTMAAARDKFAQCYQGRTDLRRVEEALMPTHAVDSPYLFYMYFDRSMPLWTDLLPDCFASDVQLLEAEWETIARDYKMVRLSDLGWQTNTDDKGEQKWKVFNLMNQGEWVVDNCKRCPRVADVLRRLSNLVADCLIGNAFFSVLPAGTVIAAHRGPTNARLRCHLGLDVPPATPSSTCSMDVGDATFSWQNGKCVVFDDSYLHAARYLSKERERAALVVDLWHPDLMKEEIECLQSVFGV